MAAVFRVKRCEKSNNLKSWRSFSNRTRQKPPALKKNIFIGELIDRTTGEQISTEDPCRDGWRSILLRDGPREFARQVKAHQKTLITDTTWRDGQQSLLATRVRTRDLEAIAKHMSYAYKDAYSLEAWGGATFDVMLRFLYEDPWQRLVSCTIIHDFNRADNSYTHRESCESLSRTSVAAVPFLVHLLNFLVCRNIPFQMLLRSTNGLAYSA